jgi:hypothetical protein
MDLLLFLELILVIVIGVQHILKLHKYESRGITVRQTALERLGRVMALLGSASVILVPRLLGVRYHVDDKSALIYFVITTLSFCVFIIGSQFQIAAFQKAEDTPRWIKQFMSLWKHFWNDGSDSV